MSKREDLEAAGAIIGEELAQQPVNLDWTKWNAEREKGGKGKGQSPAKAARYAKELKEIDDFYADVDAGKKGVKVNAREAAEDAVAAASEAVGDFDSSDDQLAEAGHEDARDSHLDAAKALGKSKAAQLHKDAAKAHAVAIKAVRKLRALGDEDVDFRSVETEKRGLAAHSAAKAAEKASRAALKATKG